MFWTIVTVFAALGLANVIFLQKDVAHLYPGSHVNLQVISD